MREYILIADHFVFFFFFIKEESKQLNSLFTKIYQDASPEVQRAMNKSFTESGMKKKSFQFDIQSSLSNYVREIPHLTNMTHNFRMQMVNFHIVLVTGGTVLSTNWKEVSATKVDVKPPTGMEFRPWTQ